MIIKSSLLKISYLLLVVLALSAVRCDSLNTEEIASQNAYTNAILGASNKEIVRRIEGRENTVDRDLQQLYASIYNESPITVPEKTYWDTIWDWYDCADYRTEADKCPAAGGDYTETIPSTSVFEGDSAEACLWRTSYCRLREIGQDDNPEQEGLPGYVEYAQAYSLWERKYQRRLDYAPFTRQEDKVYFLPYISTVRIYMTESPAGAMAVLGYYQGRNTTGDYDTFWYDPNTREDLFGCIVSSADFSRAAIGETSAKRAQNISCQIPDLRRNSRHDQVPRVQFIQLDCPTGQPDDGSFWCVRDAISLFGRVERTIVQLTSSEDARLGNLVSGVAATSQTPAIPAVPYKVTNLPQKDYLLLLSGPSSDGTLETTYTNWITFLYDRPRATLFTSLVQRNTSGDWETAGTEATCTANIKYICLLIPTVTLYDKTYVARTDITPSSSAIASAVFASIFAIWPFLNIENTVAFVLHECIDTRYELDALVGTSVGVLSLECFLKEGKDGSGTTRLVSHNILFDPILETTRDPADPSFRISSSLSIASFDQKKHASALYGMKAVYETSIGLFGVYGATQTDYGRLLDVLQLDNRSIIEQSFGVALGGGYHFAFSKGWNMGFETALKMMYAPVANTSLYGWHWQGSAFLEKTFKALTFRLSTSCFSATHLLLGSGVEEKTSPSCAGAFSARVRF